MTATTSTTTRNTMASASTMRSTRSQQAIDLSEPRFRGYCWAVDERGLTVLFHPLWAYGTDSLDEDERDRATKLTTLDFIRANKDTRNGHSYLASHRVRQHPSCGILIPGRVGEWLVYMGPTDETEQTKGQDIPIVLLYGGGKSIRIDDGQTILRLCFGNSTSGHHGWKERELYWHLNEKNEGKAKCVWCGTCLDNGEHHHTEEATKARAILERFIE